MKVKLLVSRAGADFAQSPGDIVDVSPDEAARMIEAGQAVPQGAGSVPESVRSGPAPEKAVKGRGK